MQKGYIYVITNDINNKQYVGKTKDNIYQRFKEHKQDAIRLKDKNRSLYNAMNKYGQEHFSIKLLEECPLEEISKQEKYWINKLDTYNNGYNQTLGGDGSVLYNYDLFIQDYNNGLLISEIAKKYNCCIDTVADALKNANIDTTINAKMYKKTKPVIQLDVEENILQTFSSIMDAARWIHINKSTNKDISGIGSNISKAARNNKVAYGYRWQFQNNEDVTPQKQMRIKCIETNEIFDNAKFAANWCNLKSSSGIIAACNGRQKSAGKHPITNIPLHWMRVI